MPKDTSIEARINEFMNKEYSLDVNSSSIKIIIESGFRFDSRMHVQYYICNDVQKLLKGEKFYEDTVPIAGKRKG